MGEAGWEIPEFTVFFKKIKNATPLACHGIYTTLILFYQSEYLIQAKIVFLG